MSEVGLYQVDPGTKQHSAIILLWVLPRDVQFSCKIQENEKSRMWLPSFLGKAGHLATVSIIHNPPPPP